MVALASLAAWCAAPAALERRLDRLAARPAARGWRADRWRAAGLAVGALVGLAVAVATPLSLVAAAPLVYAGAVAPTLVRERRTAGRALVAAAATRALVGRLEALVACGRPPEQALVAIAGRPTGSPELDAALQAACRSYALGAPLFAALSAEAREAGLRELAAVADELERARDLAHGSLIAIRGVGDRLRATERARTLGLASAVEGKLMLVLVLCYLPALMLSVVIPLFLGLLAGIAA